MILASLLTFALASPAQQEPAAPAEAVLSLLNQEQLPEAEALFRQAWLEDHTLAPLLAELERREQEILEQTEAEGPAPAGVRTLQRLRAKLLHQRGDLRTALQLVDQLLEGAAEEVETSNLELAELRWMQARLLDGTGRAEDAVEAYRKALPAYLGLPEEGSIRLRIALLNLEEAEEGENPLTTFAMEEGRSDDLRNRAAIVLALLGDHEAAIDLFVVSGSGQARFRQEVRVAEWAIRAEMAEEAQAHAWEARSAATLKRDRWFALTILVEAHRQDDSVDALIDRFAAADQLDEESRQVWIDLLRERERFEEARALFADRAGGSDFSVEMQRELLEMDREAGRAEDMVRSYERLIEDEPERVVWPEGLARYYLELGDEEQARQSWSRFLAHNEPGGNLLEGASALMGLGLDDLAQESAERCIADGRAKWQAYLFLFNLQQTRGRLDLAELALQRMDEAAPADAPERMQLAEAFERVGNLDRAVAVLLGVRASRGNQQIAEDLEMRLAWLLSETGQEEDALAQWQQLWRRIDSIPRRRYVEDRMMTVASRLGQLADIAIDLEKKLLAGEANARDAGLLVRLYTKVGDPVSATEVIEEYLKHSGGSEVTALQEKARVYLSCSDYRGYERTVHELMTADPEGEPDYLRQLAMSMLERGRPEQAREVLARLDELEDRTDGAEFEAGVLALAGMREEAANAYRRGIAAKPDRIESYLLLANMMAETGEKTRAIGMFQYLAANAAKDDLFTIAIDGLLNMEAGASTLQWAQRITLARLAERHDKTYLYQLLADLAEESNDKERQVAAVEGMLPIAGDRRASIVRELMDLAGTGNRRVFGQTAASSKEFLAYGRRLIGLGQLVPPQVYLDLGQAFLRSRDIKDAVRTFGLARDLPDLAQFQRETAALYEENNYLEEALATYRKALISDAGSIFLLTKVAGLLEQIGQDKEAFVLYRRATELLLARRPIRSGKKEQEESTQERRRYFARNVDDFDRFYDQARKGLVVTGAQESVDEILAEQALLFDQELAQVDDQGTILAAYPRLRDRSRFLRSLAVAFGQATLAEEKDRALLATLPEDADLLESLVRERVSWGLLPSARALLHEPGIDEARARALGYLVGEAVEPSASSLVPPTEAIGLLLPMVVNQRMDDLRELLRRIDYGDKSPEAEAVGDTLLAAAKMTSDQDLLLYVGRHRMRQMITRDNPASAYEIRPVFDGFVGILEPEHVQSLAQYFVSLILEDPENRGQAMTLLPDLQKNLEEPLLDAEQIRELVSEQGSRLMYSLGPILSLAPAEDQADLAAKVWSEVQPTMRLYFVANLLEEYQGDMPLALQDLLVDWFAVALEDANDNFFYRVQSLLEEDLLNEREGLVGRMLTALEEVHPEHAMTLAAKAVWSKHIGEEEAGLALALEVWALPVVQERSESYAWMIQNLVQENFLEDNPEPFLDQFEELGRKQTPEWSTTNQHLYRVQELEDPVRYERSLRLAIEWHPEEWSLLSRLQQALVQQDKVDEANEVLPQAMEEHPEEAEIAQLYFYALRGKNHPVEALAALEHWQTLLEEEEEVSEEEDKADDGIAPASVVLLKELVDADKEEDAALMLRRLWRTWPKGTGNNNFMIYRYYGASSGVEYPWPQEERELTEEEEAENEERSRIQRMGGLIAYREPVKIEAEEQESAWVVLADRSWAQQEMARRARALGPEGIAGKPSFLAGLARVRVLEAGNEQAAVEELLGLALAGTADATDYRLLLTLLEQYPETVTAEAQQVLGELERNVDPGDGGQLLRLARVMAATGARDRALALYRWSTTQLSHDNYFWSDDSALGRTISVRQLVREAKEVLAGDPELVPLVELALRQAESNQDSWQRESNELLAVETWAELLEPAQAIEKCREILESVTDREQPLRRQLAKRATTLLAQAGEYERALACFEVAFCKIDAGTFHSEGYFWAGNLRAQGMDGQTIAILVPEEASALPEIANWYRLLAPALLRWTEEERVNQWTADRLATLLVWRMDQVGLSEASVEFLLALQDFYATKERAPLSLIDAARFTGQDLVANQLEQELLDKRRLSAVRVPGALESVAAAEGPGAALAFGQGVLEWSRGAEIYAAVAKFAEQAEQPEVAATLQQQAEEAEAAETKLEEWAIEQAEKRRREQEGMHAMRIR